LKSLLQRRRAIWHSREELRAGSAGLQACLVIRIRMRRRAA
jgi:hypothetical protein